MQRVFSTAGVSPYDQVKWEHRTAEIKDDKGNVVFEQDGVEVPKILLEARDRHRRVEVLLRSQGDRGARVERPAARPPGDVDDRGLGLQGRLLRHRRGDEDFRGRADLPLPQPVRRVQLAGLVQRRPVCLLRGQGPSEQLAVAAATRT